MSCAGWYSSSCCLPTYLVLSLIITRVTSYNKMCAEYRVTVLQPITRSTWRRQDSDASHTGLFTSCAGLIRDPSYTAVVHCVERRQLQQRHAEESEAEGLGQLQAQKPLLNSSLTGQLNQLRRGRKPTKPSLARRVSWMQAQSPRAVM